MKKILLLALLLSTSSLIAQTVTVGSTTLTERTVATGLVIPWEIIWGPDDFIWSTERTGLVRRINPTTGNMVTVLDLSSDIAGGSSNEPGLLGMELHPDFLNTPKVYLVYNYFSGGSVKEKLVSYDWNGAALVNEVILLGNISGANIHNGARLLFLPDGTLLMTTGDRGNSSTSQDLSSLNGKTLRVNQDGTIPSDNPDPNSYVYTYGNRNAQGLCMAPNGTIYSSEHGQNHSDEINVLLAGKNYGWPNVEGPCDTGLEMNYCNNNATEEPIWAWTNYCIAPNGMEFYDHPAIPEWQGDILVAILGGISAQEPRISHLELSTDGLSVIAENEYFTTFGRIRDICVNPHNGAIYFATNGGSYPGSGPNRIIEYRNLNFTTSNNNVAVIDQYVKISPNPLVDYAMVEFSDSFLGGEFQIISYNGQRTTSGTINDSYMNLNKADFAAGLYYIQASSKKGTVTQTFVVR